VAPNSLGKRLNARNATAETNADTSVLPRLKQPVSAVKELLGSLREETFPLAGSQATSVRHSDFFKPEDRGDIFVTSKCWPVTRPVTCSHATNGAMVTPLGVADRGLAPLPYPFVHLCDHNLREW
jgi:hypothetical protein